MEYKCPFCGEMENGVYNIIYHIRHICENCTAPFSYHGTYAFVCECGFQAGSQHTSVEQDYEAMFQHCLDRGGLDEHLREIEVIRALRNANLTCGEK